MDVSWLQAVVLGVVEGVTEFLPISSTAHLLIVSQLLGFQESVPGLFEIFIQLGAVVAVVGYYFRDLIAQASALPRDRTVARFWLAVGLAFLPIGVFGFLLRDFITGVLFDSPVVIAAALIVGGVVLLIVDRRSVPPKQRDIAGRTPVVTVRQALIIGFAQAVALIPGTSRSAAAIVGGLSVGLDRSTATAFSFYLAIPTLGVATVYQLARSISSVPAGELGVLAIGTIVATIVAFLSIGWLLRYVATHSFRLFALYRVGAGLVVLALVAMGRL